mmetsp:Transcript_44889/g.138497  ORF Transcript_44889/g.138497 Transcript_44889/m.138497 type:complete len:253 (+) Transcript_44889:244-1002(+)
MRSSVTDGRSIDITQRKRVDCSSEERANPRKYPTRRSARSAALGINRCLKARFRALVIAEDREPQRVVLSRSCLRERVHDAAHAVHPPVDRNDHLLILKAGPDAGAHDVGPRHDIVLEVFVIHRCKEPFRAVRGRCVGISDGEVLQRAAVVMPNARVGGTTEDCQTVLQGDVRQRGRRRLHVSCGEVRARQQVREGRIDGAAAVGGEEEQVRRNNAQRGRVAAEQSLVAARQAPEAQGRSFHGTRVVLGQSH